MPSGYGWHFCLRLGQRRNEKEQIEQGSQRLIIQMKTTRWVLLRLQTERLPLPYGLSDKACGCRKNVDFCAVENATMKNLSFLILLFAVTVAASAQTVQPVSSNTVKFAPVLRSYVPPEVVERAIKLYGRELYCLEKGKSPDGRDGYLAGLIRNGKFYTEWFEVLKMVLHRDKALRRRTDVVS